MCFRLYICYPRSHGYSLIDTPALTTKGMGVDTSLEKEEDILEGPVPISQID